MRLKGRLLCGRTAEISAIAQFQVTASPSISPHYRDQTELWRRGKYLRLSEDDENPDASSLVLTPAQ